MPSFHYRGRNADGSPTSGTKEAADKFAVYRDLRAEGITVTSVDEAKAASGFSRLSDLVASFGGVPLHERVTFARNLGAMLDAGLPLSRALTVMERQIRHSYLNRIVVEVNESVKGGKTLSESLARYPKVFGQLFVSMVRAGEESGTVSKALKNVADQMNAVYLLQKKVKGALIYPAVILSLMVVIAILMLVLVVPTLTATFKDLKIELPWSTKLIIAVSDSLQTHPFLYIFGVAILIPSVIAFLRAKPTKRVFDSVVLRVPIIGNLVKETNAARTSRTLSSLLAAGVDVVLAMEITENVVQNALFRAVLTKAKETIKRGDPVAAIFEANERLYPPLVGEMVSIGEETGKLGEMLAGVATFYETEVDQKTKDLSSVIEPFLMIFIGVGVGFFALAMIMPTMSLVNAI